jgi:hypothetical protein
VKKENQIKKKYKIGPSSIHGNGIICTETIEIGEIIDIAIVKNLSTNEIIISPDFGVYINHQMNSNTKLELIRVHDHENYYIIAIKQIQPKEEITCNYDGEDIPSFIDRSKSHYS